MLPAEVYPTYLRSYGMETSDVTLFFCSWYVRTSFQLRPKPCIQDRRLETPTNTPQARHILLLRHATRHVAHRPHARLLRRHCGRRLGKSPLSPPPPPGQKKKKPVNPISNRSTNSSSCPKRKTRRSRKSTSSSASRRPSWYARTLRASRRPPGTCLRCVGAGFSGRVRRVSCRRGSWSGGWILWLGRRGRGRRQGGRRGKRGRGDFERGG